MKIIVIINLNVQLYLNRIDNIPNRPKNSQTDNLVRIKFKRKKIKSDFLK